MPVTIDHETCEVEQLGLNTVGQVLSHASRNNRLVVNMLIDGQQPDLNLIGEIRQYPVIGKTLFMLASLAMPAFTITGWMMYLQRRSREKLLGRRGNVPAQSEETHPRRARGGRQDCARHRSGGRNGSAG